ncbi:MAG: AMP-binding protein, partial [Persicimonas sp.]
TAGVEVVLTQTRWRDQIPQMEGVTLAAIDEVIEKGGPMDTLSPFGARDREVGPDDACFILFTSGTTGEPNGVEVTHGNVANILLTAPGNLEVEPGMRVSQILSIAFDMAAWETFICLANGGELVIRGRDIQEAVEKADVVIATPTLLGKLDVERCRHIQAAAVAGEPCPRPLAETWSEFCRFYNACGPTETTIVNTMKHFESADDNLTIGAPTPNNTVYVLDEDGKPCDIGEIGEMWAGGRCVTAGYLNNDVLNKERYRPDPFLGGDHVMFRTRDLGRWTEDGELEHHGRTDDQVKVRGFRVELDSVSAVLERAPDCEQATTLRLDKRTLASFVTPASVDIERAREIVAETLPYYCVPPILIALDDIPTTNRGKVDRSTLEEIAAEYREANEASTDNANRGGRR